MKKVPLGFHGFKQRKMDSSLHSKCFAYPGPHRQMSAAREVICLAILDIPNESGVMGGGVGGRGTRRVGIDGMGNPRAVNKGATVES